MWFPTFDKIHNLQRKFEKSLNSDLIDSEKASVYFKCMACVQVVSLKSVFSE